MLPAERHFLHAGHRGPLAQQVDELAQRALVRLAHEVATRPAGREMDMLLTAGERMSMALVSMAIANLGDSARSFTGSQAGVITDDTHGKARIIDDLITWIRANLDHPIQLQDLEARSGYSQRSLRNAFHEGSSSPTGQVLHSVVVKDSLLQAAERYGWKEA